MMKRSISAILISTMLLGATPMAFADSSGISIQIDGQTQTFDQPPVIVDDYTLVPLRGVFETLGAQVTWDAQSNTATITKDSIKLQVTVNSNFAVKNGNQVKMDTQAEIINNRVMVPLRFIAETLGADVAWDNSNRTVLISSKGFFSDTNQANGSTVAAPLNYQTAVNMALSTSYKVKNALAQVEQSKDILDNTADKVKFTPSYGSNVVADQIFTGYAEANLGYQVSQKTVGILEDTVSFAVKQAYDSVLGAQQAKNLADLAVENSLTQLQVAQVQQQNGMLSDIDLSQKNNDYNNAVANQQAAEKSLEIAYQKLNQLIGLSSDARPQLLDVPQMQPLGNVDITAKVSQVDSESPLLWQADQQVNLEQLKLKLYPFNNNDASIPPYDASKLNVTIASNNVNDYKNQMDTAVRSLYNGIKAYEDQYSGYQSQLQSAQDALTKLQDLYNVGMATKAQIVSAQLGLEKIKNDMFNTVIQHDISMLEFDKPWVLGGSQSSSNNQ